MQEYIRNRAQAIYGRIHDLLTELGYTHGSAPDGIRVIALEEITLAIAEHEAAAWQPLSRKPGEYDPIMIALRYSDKKDIHGKPIITVSAGMYQGGMYYVLRHAARTSSDYVSMGYLPLPSGWQMIAWRQWPRYSPPLEE